MNPTTVTWFDDEEVLADTPSPSSGWLAGRYELGAFLGAGGSGRVHAATDHLSKQQVAVKIVPRLTGRDRIIRRELVALRMLDLPGVVRLLDDGELDDTGARFLVMPLLSGGTFDDLAARGGWTTWSAEAHALLEALARVHHAGFVHRDLKPGNVLLDAEGWPVITDFGLAREPALDEARPGIREGTPRYMSPEQLAGEPGDIRSDLYAVGCMFAEMLEEAGAPTAVSAVVEAMRAPEPGDRFASAVEVLEALGADPRSVVGSLASLPDPATHADLRALFEDPPATLLHIAEDAAGLLHARTEGRREAVRAELDSWVRQGRAHWDGQRIVMNRPSLERLQWADDAELRAFVERRHTASDSLLAEALLRRSDEMRRLGQPTRAFGLLDTGLVLLTERGPRRRILEQLASVAITLSSEDAVRAAMYRAERAEATDLLGLLHGVRLSLRGDPIRALAYLRESRFSGEVELARYSQLVLTTSHADPDQLDEALAEAAKASRRSKVAEGRAHIWQGNVAYARADYPRAVDQAQRAAALLVEAPAYQLSAWLNAGFAALEVPDLELAVQLAEDAERVARRLRHGLAEGNAYLLGRLARLRLRVDQLPRPAMVEAAFQLSGRLGSLFALVEASIAYRQS
ncbi:MAG: serine/threonine-protein kinase, partial [Myxococcota bacterium]